ncbi:MAG TPA: hypothetical protein VMT88_14400 [Actinomycetes bacterium]|nr:hypothetical protein [Actinomycetes bacterium]
MHAQSAEVTKMSRRHGSLPDVYCVFGDSKDNAAQDRPGSVHAAVAGSALSFCGATVAIKTHYIWPGTVAQELLCLACSKWDPTE